MYQLAITKTLWPKIRAYSLRADGSMGDAAVVAAFSIIGVCVCVCVCVCVSASLCLRVCLCPRAYRAMAGRMDACARVPA